MKTSISPLPEPDQDEPRRLEDILSKAKSWRVQRLAMRDIAIAAPSTGELALPWLILLMNSCCIVVGLIGLASLGLSGYQLLLPLWTPFLLMGVTYGVIVRLSRFEQEQRSTLGVVGGIVAVALLLFICWARFYSDSAFFLDPRWLLTFLSDLLFLNGKAFLILFVCLCSALMMWQAIRLGAQSVEPSQCMRLLIIGLVMLGLVLLIRLATPNVPSLAYVNVLLLLLIPIYISLGLGAHALAHIVLLRRFHPGGLDGSQIKQERSLGVAMGVWGLLLLAVTLILASVISPDFLEVIRHLLVMLGVLYNWLVQRLADLLTLLVSPIFWLLSLFHYHSSIPPVNPPRARNGAGGPPPAPLDVNALLAFSKVFLVILIILVVVLIAFLMRRLQYRISVRKRERDVHESVWSWALFRNQLKLLFLALFGRFFRRQNADDHEAKVDDLRELDPQVRNIREIYRALLKRSASIGQPRHISETPNELNVRLGAKTPAAEVGLTTITEAYLDTRYGGAVPGSDEVARVQQNWRDVEQKWRNVKS